VHRIEKKTSRKSPPKALPKIPEQSKDRVAKKKASSIIDELKKAGKI
jgi:hypothetical protein